MSNTNFNEKLELWVQSVINRDNHFTFVSLLTNLPEDPEEACAGLHRILEVILSQSDQGLLMSQLSMALEQQSKQPRRDVVLNDPAMLTRTIQGLMVLAFHYRNHSGEESPDDYVGSLQSRRLVSCVEALFEIALNRQYCYAYLRDQVASPLWKQVEVVYDIENMETSALATLMHRLYPQMLPENQGVIDGVSVTLPEILSN